MDQIQRLFQIILMLPRHPRFLTSEIIVRKLENQNINCDLRMAQRDIIKISESLKSRVTLNKVGNQHQLSWRRETDVINPRLLTINQSMLLVIINKYMAKLVPSKTLKDMEALLQEADSTLDASNNALLAWTKKIAIVQPTQSLIMPDIDPNIQESVSEALLKDNQISIRYRRTDGNENHYALNPLGLVLRNGILYLVASKIDNNEMRIFALHRFLDADILPSPSHRPEQFELQTFIDQGGMGFDLTGNGLYTKIRLKAIFDSITANHLSESRLSQDQVIKKIDASRYLITATLQETEQLFWWLLSFGSRVEVLEPLALRDKMANESKAMLARYFGNIDNFPATPIAINSENPC